MEGGLCPAPSPAHSSGRPGGTPGAGLVARLVARLQQLCLFASDCLGGVWVSQGVQHLGLWTELGPGQT